MDLLQFTRHFESAIESVTPGSLQPVSEFRHEIAGWDSLAALSVLAMIDAEYEVTVKANDFIACETIADVYKLVEAQKS